MIALKAKYIALTLVAAIAISIEGSSAATLTLGQANTSSTPNTVSIPLTLNNELENQVSGVQVDVSFDGVSLLLNDVIPGPAADDSDKEVIFNLLESGKARIMVSGFNQSLMGDGVLAQLSFQVQNGVLDGSYQVAFDDIRVTNPVGLEVPTTGVVGAVVVGDSGEGEGEGEIPIAGCAASSTHGVHSRHKGDLVLAALAISFLLSSALVTNRKKNLTS